MLKKKSQLKIQQMSLMLLAVILFFVLAGLFFLSIKTRTLKQDAALMEKDKALLDANFLAGTAEFSCGENCIDTDRVVVLKNVQAYKDFWQVSSIEIRKIYPESDGEIECSLGNYPNCNLYKVYYKKVASPEQSSEGAEKVSSFVTLCRREKSESYEYKKCELGELIIGQKTTSS